MPDFAQHASNLQFGRIVLKSVTLSCSAIQMLAWNDVITRGVDALLPLSDATLAAALCNALVTTAFSVSLVFLTYRAVRCAQRMSVHVT